MRIFLGRTQDVEALKYYPLFFGKYEKEKKSTSSGSSGGGRNSSVTISTQKEEIYESKDFASLEPGEFIGMGNRSNIKGHFRKKFRLFELEEEPLPVVAFRTEKEISDNYTRILKDIERVLGMKFIIEPSAASGMIRLPLKKEMKVPSLWEIMVSKYFSVKIYKY